MNYLLYGRGPSPLLLLHGFTGQGSHWAAVEPLLGAQHHLICPDLVGHGRAPAPTDLARYTMPAVAQELIALLDELGVAKVDLLGYSMGGRLALYLALHYPERFGRVVLESASPGLATAAERTARQQSDEALAERIEREGMASFVAHWESLPLWASQASLPAEVRQRLHQQRLEHNPTGLANSLRGMGTGVQPNLWPRLAELKMPVTLVVGELDHKFVAINEQMAAQIKSAVLHIIPHAGHTVHLEQPESWGALV